MNVAIGRVVVTLDAVSETAAAIETAVRLAVSAGAPLHGVFVEDEELIGLASLSFVRQTTPARGTEDFSPEQATLSQRAAAERGRRELTAAARRHGLRMTYEIVRAAATALAAATDRDVIVAGVTTRPVAGSFRMECRWWGVIDAAPGPLLLARRVGASTGGVAVLLRDRSPAADRLVTAAATHAAAGDGMLTVIAPPAVADAADFDGWLAEQAVRHAVRVRIEITPDDPDAVEARIAARGIRLLAVPGSLAEGGAAALRALSARLACDLLVVR